MLNSLMENNAVVHAVGEEAYLLPRILNLPVDQATKAAWNQTLADLPPGAHRHHRPIYA